MSNGNMHIGDVFHEIIHVLPFDENKRHQLVAAVNDEYAEQFDALDDEAKSNRRAPIDRSAASAPAMFAGGITQAQLDSIVAAAVARALAANGNGKNVQHGQSGTTPDSGAVALQQPQTPPTQDVPPPIESATVGQNAQPSQQAQPAQPSQTQAAEPQDYSHVAAPAPAQSGFGDAVKS